MLIHKNMLVLTVCSGPPQAGPAGGQDAGPSAKREPGAHALEACRRAANVQQAQG